MPHRGTLDCIPQILPSANVGMKMFQDDDINYRTKLAKNDENG
ncbi:unnamed protein product [Fusarium graminearum]|uniref:Chromosome 2, complete genome n=1 Tax=Gibberella zeae (strain ATCC MYA-4620 / CBS 123657 / FGSC 9075 / NRRL 31084 / PH-1) TaxID=229533 RepID=A0A098DFA1_GIBZE|nr:unnamed protein product [Fusarium graminearum]CZS80893.1 unnamed protein product [Fusarium graminearum]